MSKADSRLEALNSGFEKIFAIANSLKTSADGITSRITLSILTELRHQVLAEEAKFIRKDPKEFTLDEAVQGFDLIYLSEGTKYLWRIDELPDVGKTFQPSACLVSLLENYIGIYDRTSEAACRIPVDFLLCECITVLQGRDSDISPSQATEDGRAPTPWDPVKVYCDVSFTHTIDIPTSSKDILIGGRVDHVVGIAIRSQKTFNRLFHSLLLCIDAKFYGNLLNAMAQLVVYLACIRQSRINRERSDTSVYGVVTDGLSYVFVTITHEGVLKQSKQFDIMQGDLSTVLGCLRFILEMAMSMTKFDELEDDAAGDPIYPDDTPYLHHDNEE